MNISTADFDWISLLLVIGAGVIGLIKSTAKKGQSQRPVFEFPERMEEEENIADVESGTATGQQAEEPVIVSDFYRDPKISSQLTDSPDDEAENDGAIHFDIRQAVISSEILKRPEY